MTIVSFESFKADDYLTSKAEADDYLASLAEELAGQERTTAMWLRELEKPLAVPFTRLWDAIQDDSFTTEEVRLIAENPATARVFMSCYRVKSRS